MLSLLNNLVGEKIQYFLSPLSAEVLNPIMGLIVMVTRINKPHLRTSLRIIEVSETDRVPTLVRARTVR